MELLRRCILVITAVTPNVALEPIAPAKIPHELFDGGIAKNRTNCPRCRARLRTVYHEPECLQCGYVDYDYVDEHPTNGRKSTVSTGTRYVLRYVGDFPSLVNTLTHTQLRRVGNRAVYHVGCPFCLKPMMQSSLSGKRREVREERYKCTEGHRVSLTPRKNGSLGWK
jgi:hypothetical protein